MLEKTHNQPDTLPSLLKAGMESIGYMVYNAHRAASAEELWAVFEAFISKGPVSHWLYFPLAPFENQLAEYDSAPTSGPFRATQTQDTLSTSTDQFLRDVLRSLEGPIALQETESFQALSEDKQNSLAKDLSVSDIDLIHLVPSFGAKGFNGGFVIMRNKDTLPAKLEQSENQGTCGDRGAPLGIACQVTHNIYIDRFAKTPKLSSPLTPRERDILEGLSRGLSNTEIAACCGLSAHTVNGYLRRIFLKTNAPNRTTAVLKGFATGLIR